MGFEMEVFQRLDAIERGLSALRNDVAAIGLTVRSGPFAGVPVRPGLPTADPIKLAETKALLADLGQYAPGDSLISQWLVRYSPAEIVSAIRKLLANVPGENNEVKAYNFSVKAHAGGGWKNVFPKLAGEPTGPIVSPDKFSNLLKGLSNVNSPADLEVLCPEVIRRAKAGIDWTGQVRMSGEDLRDAKDALNGKPIPEWIGWRDASLLEVLVLTNNLPVAKTLFHDYPDVSVFKTQTLAEWLFDQKLASE